MATEPQSTLARLQPFRERNLDPEPYRLSEAELRKLDSSLKKNSAFIKRLKAFSDSNADALLKELKTLNLTKYVSEAVQAIVQAVVEGKVKPSDVMGMISICSTLHQLYRDFAQDLITSLAKAFDVTTVVEESIAAQKQQMIQQQQAEKTPTTATSIAPVVNTGVDKNITRLKIILRLLGEFLVAGLYSDATILHRCVSQLTSSTKVRAGGAVLMGLVGVATVFVKYFAVDLLGVKSPPATETAEKLEEVSPVLPAKTQNDLYHLMADDFLKHVCDVLDHAFKDIAETRADNERMINSRGELTEDQRKLFEKKKAYLEKYHGAAVNLAEMLGQPEKIPPMPELTVTPNANNQNIYFTSYSLAPQLASELPAEPLEPLPAFEDDETRLFYEELPDLTRVIPEHIIAGKKGHQAEVDEEEEDGDKEVDTPKTKKKTDGTSSASPLPKEEKKAAEAAAMEELLSRLTKACTKDLVDQLAVDFCHFCFGENEGPVMRNHKLYRSKLLRAIFNVPRTMLELLPYHARLVASLNQYLKDMGPTLLTKLEEEFQSLFAAKNQMNIESKICNIRFIGELTKFRICPEAVILRLLSKCLDDFAHHNIEVACALLDTCGRFLLRQSCSHVRTSNLLQQMMRLRAIKTLDARHETMIDAAFYGCVPRGKYKQFKEPKTLTPIQQYIRHLLTEELNRQSLKKVLKQLRKLDWDDPATMPFIVKSLRRVGRTKFSSVHLVASLTAALAGYYEEIGVKVVDSVLEDIRYGLETDTPSQAGALPPQRRLLDLRFFGELYNYRLFDANLIFEVLYQILFYAAYNDTPQETFRIRMVCTLLEATAPYFLDTPSSRKKLLRFMPYFYRFVLSKSKPFPVDLDFTFAELLELVQSLLPAADASAPSMKFPESLSAVNELIADMEAKLLWGHVLHHQQSRSGAFTVLYIYQLLHGPERGLQLANQIALAPDLQAALQAAKEVAVAISPLSEEKPGAVWAIIRPAAGSKEETEDDGDDEEEEDRQDGKVRHRVDDDDYAMEGDAEMEDSGDEKASKGKSEVTEDASPKLPKGRFLVPPGFDMQAISGGNKREVDAEAKEFDDMMNALMRESMAEVQTSMATKRVLSSGVGKKLANNMALPLNLYLTKMSAHEEAQSMRVSEAEEEEPIESEEERPNRDVMQFAIVLKRKSEGKQATKKDATKEATVDTKGTKEVVVRRLPVPMETRLAREKQKALEAHRKALEDNKRHVLEYERRSSGRPPATMGTAHLYHRESHQSWHS